ncbi:hypothetical protein EDC94DRAFT_511857 [Helicostylum pulchrum]|nr:hypothetical protein EDC94DRAFT_511857 [Helicostylum pulchrum]
MSVYPIPPHPYNNSRSHLNHYHLPSPPTSVIDGVLVANHDVHYHHNNQHVVNGGITNNSQKVFSFVPLPGLNQKKRPRRKFHEVERLYQCNYQDCSKSYGTLNHLNAHVSMQRHGPKRQPTEFKELRKMWRKQKRDNKQRSNSRSTSSSLDDHEEGQQEQSLSNNSMLGHSANNAGPILSHHHEYMPPYMHHPHPSLMSHPPPPPPPPTLWRPHYQQQQPEFMPHPGY